MNYRLSFVLFVLIKVLKNFREHVYLQIFNQKRFAKAKTCKYVIYFIFFFKIVVDNEV